MELATSEISVLKLTPRSVCWQRRGRVNWARLISTDACSTKTFHSLPWARPLLLALTLSSRSVLTPCRAKTPRSQSRPPSPRPQPSKSTLSTTRKWSCSLLLPRESKKRRVSASCYSSCSSTSNSLSAVVRARLSSLNRRWCLRTLLRSFATRRCF